MSEAFLGEIRAVAFGYAPRGWALCNGAILPIAQNTALFSLLGTTYGGNGQTTFALPDLQGRLAVGSGQGPGLSPYDLGQQGGTETYTLQQSEMGSHTHTMVCTSAAGSTIDPTNNFAVPTTKEVNLYAAAANATAIGTMVNPNGGGQAHENRQPFLTLNYVICMSGIFPSRS